MTSMLQNDGLITRVLCDEADWDSIRQDWDKLYAVSPTASTPLDFVWMRNWWNVFGSQYGGRGLRIVTVWRGSQLIALLPLYMGFGKGGRMGARQLRFISTGEQEYEETCPDYLNLLYLPGEEEVCVHAVGETLARMDWDSLTFPDMPLDSPLLRLTDRFTRAVKTAVIQRGVCPIVDLGNGFESYLERLSSKTRMRARQEIRKVERSGAVFEVASALDAYGYFDDFISLHQARWTSEGKPGCFAAPRFTEFHRRLIGEWVPSGRAILARLSHEGNMYAILYGFITRAKFDLYQLGVKRHETGMIHSPGTVSHYLLMAALVKRGVTQYDFLKGSSPIKESLATDHRQLVSLRCEMPNLRARLDRVYGLCDKIGTKINYLITRR